jgi:transposase InsO family protein
VEHVVAEHGVSERFACRVLGQHRSTQRKIPRKPDDEAALTANITALAIQYGRYGYRRIAAMLGDQGWVVNVKRVERIWRREGLKVPARQPKRGRLWLNDGSCIRLRPEHPNHVWSYDFVEDRTHDGRKYRMLNVIDEFTRECIAIRVSRKLKAVDVIDVLSDLFILRGVPSHIRSDNGPEFIAKALRDWIAAGLPFGSPADPQVVAIAVEPREQQLAAGARRQLKVTAVYSDGRAVDVTRLAVLSVSGRR